MQGLLYRYLRDFVELKFDAALWNRVRERAGVTECFFVLTRAYPDRYLPALIRAFRHELGEAAPTEAEVLFEFGRHLGRRFERDFDVYFKRFVSAREMLAGIEPVIHAELRRRNPNCQPPFLRTWPLPGGGLRVAYDSPRRLCDLLRGLATHVALAFGQTITIEEPFCMKRGDPACEFKLTFARSEFPRSDASPP